MKRKIIFADVVLLLTIGFLIYIFVDSCYSLATWVGDYPLYLADTAYASWLPVIEKNIRDNAIMTFVTLVLLLGCIALAVVINKDFFAKIKKEKISYNNNQENAKNEEAVNQESGSDDCAGTTFA